MLKIKNKLRYFYTKIVGSIAFYPTLITIVFVAVAILMLGLENYKLKQLEYKIFDYILISNQDTARTILSTIIGGIMSLMVFSFSTVMLLLNQASTNFSPRVLPGLIANKRHQIVLGFFLGTIVYCLLVSINILPDARDYKVPGLATFIGVLCGLASLIMFVYFLHSISKSIQIDYIIKDLYQKTYHELKEEIAKKNIWSNQLPDTANWYPLRSPKTGYFQNFSSKALLEISEKKDTKIILNLPIGSFTLKGEIVGFVEKDMDEETEKELLSCLLFNSEEHIYQNFLNGFKQITEIVVKAMSPGINDPGTALVGINYLSELLRLRMQLPDNKKLKSEEHDGEVYVNGTNFEDTFYLHISAIRQYIRHDITVLIRLMDLYQSLLSQEDIEKEKEEYLQQQLKTLMADIEEHITNEFDKKMLLSLGTKILKEKVVEA